MESSVLLYGTDLSLLKTRKMVLERTGLDVTLTLNLVEVDRVARNAAVHLLILCHTLKVEEREAAIELLAGTHPAAKTIILTKSYITPAVERSRALVSSAAGPRGLLATVDHLLNSSR